MALDEYKRKRDFKRTPEPEPKIEKTSANRFVVQKHRASHLHYDFRLEMEGVLKSWAVPKGPSLDPADKRLAMQTEDHPVSYFDFEGIIPPGNYGAGTVMVWDVGTWEAEGNASEMLAKGDLKFRLSGEKLKGSFVLAKMRSRRPGSKGNEWLMIKHRDDQVVSGYDIDKYDYSVLTGRTLDEIAADESSAEWQSNRVSAASAKNGWLAEAIAVADRKGASAKTGGARKSAGAKRAASTKSPSSSSARTQKSASSRKIKSAAKSSSSDTAAVAEPSAPATLGELNGTMRAAMPQSIRPMLATLVDEPFSDKDWVYEIKWDGYRALAFIDDGKVRLVSRNGNDMTAQFPEMARLADHIRARRAVVDGELVAFDEDGRPSFSVMQQRTGIGGMGRKVSGGDTSIGVQYYAFDLIYLDGYDLRRVDLINRKELLSQIISPSELIRYSEHFDDGLALYSAAKERGLEGIVAKRRRGCYTEKRTREWLKMKVTLTAECVIGGYTDPRGSREHFGSLILGLYDEKNRLIHVGHAGSGFSDRTHAEMWNRLKELETTKSPFHGKVEATRRPHWVRPEMVAQIKFTEWTHEGQSGTVKLRAPVFLGLRLDKPASECRFEHPGRSRTEVERAKAGEAA